MYRHLATTIMVILCLWVQLLYAQEPNLSKRTQARATFQSTLTKFLVDQDVIAARKGFLLAISQDPSYALPRFNLGILAESSEEWGEAIKWFEEFLKLDAKSSYVDKAKQEIKKIEVIRQFDLNPEKKRERRYNDAIALARAFLESDLPREAIVEAAIAAEIDGNRWESYSIGASALGRQKLFDEAIIFIQKAIERAPVHVKTELSKYLAQFRKEKRQK